MFGSFAALTFPVTDKHWNDGKDSSLLHQYLRGFPPGRSQEFENVILIQSVAELFEVKNIAGALGRAGHVVQLGTLCEVVIKQFTVRRHREESASTLSLPDNHSSKKARRVRWILVPNSELKRTAVETAVRWDQTPLVHQPTLLSQSKTKTTVMSTSATVWAVKNRTQLLPLPNACAW